MNLHIREKKNSIGTTSIIIVNRRDRKYKVIETIGCAKNEIDKKIYLDIAKIRLNDLKKQMYPTLFDTVEEKKELKRIKKQERKL